MSVEELKAVFRRVVDEVWNKGNSQAFEELFATDFVYHDPTAPDVHSVEDYRRHIGIRGMLWDWDFGQSFIADSPDGPRLNFTIEDMIAEGDKVAVRYTISAPQQPESTGGIRPTPSNKKATVICICRIADGKIAELWSVWRL